MDISNQCLSVFKSFIKDIIKVFPEYKIKLEDIYGHLLKIDTCVLDNEELLKEFLDRVHKLNKKITNKDETMFINDPLILTDISFKNIWSTNISYKTKETIWKYLQTFCLLILNYQSNKELEVALSELSDNKELDISDKKIASDVKKIKKMTDNIKEPIAEELNNSSDNSIENPLADIMGNSDIGKLAEEVSKSLDIESMLGSMDTDNPIELFQNLMSGDAMGKIMNTINTVVSEKVEKGEINENDMKNQAENIYKKLDKSPFNNIQKEMEKSISPQTDLNNSHNSNKTKQRLQKKLKEKQKVQVNKV